jgi:hypothetical protein
MPGEAVKENEGAGRSRVPNGFSAMGAFLFFGAAMASLAGTTLIWRGTFLDGAWRLNASAYGQLTRYGRPIGVLFFALGLVLASAGVGWFLRRFWGWAMAVGIIAVQVLGDVLNAFLGQFVRGAVGAAIAGALLIYLLRPRVRGVFERLPTPNRR